MAFLPLADATQNDLQGLLNDVLITAFDVDLDGSINAGTSGVTIHGSVAAQQIAIDRAASIHST